MTVTHSNIHNDEPTGSNEIDAAALTKLIETAYADIKRRLTAT